MHIIVNRFSMFRFLDIAHNVQCKQILICKIFRKSNPNMIQIRILIGLKRWGDSGSPHLTSYMIYLLPLWKMIGNCRLASSGSLSSMYALTGIMNSLFGSFAHASHIFSQNRCLGCFESASLTLDLVSRLVMAWRVGMQT